MPPAKLARNPHALFSIEGHCLRPQFFSYLDLREIHSDYQVDDLALVDERLAGKGVRLRKLIDIAGPGDGCEYLTIESAEVSYPGGGRKVLAGLEPGKHITVTFEALAK